MLEQKLLLKQAFIDAALRDADEICKIEKKANCSNTHIKRLSAMGISTGISRKAKILIAIVAAALLLTGCVIYREQIANLLLNFGDGFVNIESDGPGDVPKEIEHSYIASYIPEGFTEVEREEKEFYCSTKWVDRENEKYFLLKQWTIDSFSESVDTEHATSTQINYGDLCILKIANRGYFFYYWKCNGYVFSLTCNYDMNDYSFSLFLDGLK